MITLNKISSIIDGTVKGDGEVMIKGMTSAILAKPGDLTYAMDESQLEMVKSSKASCVMTTLETKDYPKPVLKVKDMKEALTVVYNTMVKLTPLRENKIHPSSVIEDNAIFGENIYVGANSVIAADVTIGNNVKIFPNVTIYSGTVIGNNVTIHSGTVIGADGFGYIQRGGEIYKVPQMGAVIINDNVEIGANVCIDRGTFDNTVIGENSKIDNLVQVAHNVKIGKNVFIAGLSGIGGSVTIGNNVMMGGQVGIKDHSKIEDNVKIGARAGIIKNFVKEGSTFFGYPAKDADTIKKELAFLSWLTKKRDKIMKLFKEIPD